MYKVVYEEGLFWIWKDGFIIDDLGGFIDPLTPEMIIEEIDEDG